MNNVLDEIYQVGFNIADKKSIICHSSKCYAYIQRFLWVNRALISPIQWPKNKIYNLAQGLKPGNHWVVGMETYSSGLRNHWPQPFTLF